MITLKGVMFRAEYTDNDMNVCVDKVVDRLASQITRYKKKIQKNHKQNRQILFDAVPENEEEEIDLKPVRSKTFDITPMDVDEAILQMELLDHTFFVFMNADTGRVAVVYKREDGQYGLWSRHIKSYLFVRSGGRSGNGNRPESGLRFPENIVDL